MNRTKKSSMVLTFDRVDNTTHTLKDIAVTTMGKAAINRSTFYIKFFGDNGAMAKIATDSALQTFNPTAWTTYGANPNEELVFYFHTDKHWYLYPDTTRLAENQMDDYPLVDGRGFYVFSNAGLDKGAKIQCNGQVATNDLPITIARTKRFMTGNTAPKDMTLSEFVVASTGKAAINRNTFYVKFFGDDGAMAKIKTDTTLQTFNPTAWATYGANAGEELVFYFHTDKHWYLYPDTTRLAENRMDNYPISAGRGMIPQANAGLDKGVSFTVPGVDL